jgi:hypothetical protein
MFAMDSMHRVVAIYISMRQILGAFGWRFFIFGVRGSITLALTNAGSGRR